MSAGSVGAVVRARAAASRRVGAGQVPSLGSSSSLAEALSRLASGPYGHDARPGQGLRRAQHEVAATYLWNLRVLAGWAPREGARAMRLLAGWAEIANVEGLLRRFDGDPDPVPPYRLGSLATAWPLLERATDRAELRRELAATAWGDPGGEDDHAVTLVLRLVWAARVRSGVPAATTWAAGAAALFLALDLCTSPRPHSPTETAAAARVLGPGAAAATTLEELRAALPRAARWALAGCSTVEDLWRAEVAWWLRVERDATVMRTSPRFDLTAVLGVVGLLGVDAWRVRAALEIADRGGAPVEALDALL
jgi:hypothetical protein